MKGWNYTRNYQTTLNRLRVTTLQNNENTKIFIGHGSSHEWLKLQIFLQDTN